MRARFAVRWPIAALAGLLACIGGIGCGDGPICRSEVLVLIQSPGGPIAVDDDPAAPGVQTDVRVQSTLPPGATATLIVEDAEGAAVSTTTATAAADGAVEFSGVTVPAGRATFRVEGDAGRCGSDEDTVTVDVTVGRGCELALRPAPVANDFYAPVPVLNGSLDPDPATAGFQTSIDVTTTPGWDVELFAATETDETSVGTGQAGEAGTATFALALADGRLGLRAVCMAPGGQPQWSSLTTTVLIDSAPPDCAITYPAPGSTITPGYDRNGDLGDGVQLTLLGRAGPDAAGETGTFVVTAPGGADTMLTAAISAGGEASTDAVMAPASTPAEFRIAFSAADHAGNACSVESAYPVIYQGCDILIASPTGVVTRDVDDTPGNGSQIDVALTVSTTCAGRTVTSDCGLDPPSGVVPASGQLTLRVTVCATSPCEADESCAFHVMSPDGVATAAGAQLDFDDVAPPVAVELVAPALGCGAQVTPAVDVAPDPGVQIRARVVSADAAQRELEVINGAGTSTVDAAGDVVVTLSPGVNNLRGAAEDAVGNRGVSASCAITLADLAVSFLPPSADGAVGRNDGAVHGGSLTFNLCGTVSTTGAGVTVAVDGGPAQIASVDGATWCRLLTLGESPPEHTLVVTAQAGASFGQATLVLHVDITPPGAVTDLAGRADTRRSIQLAWTAPADGTRRVFGYRVKYATTMLTDANFDATGTVLAAPAPAAPGTAEMLPLVPVRAGTSYWLGVAALDEVGNRSAAAIVGPIAPALDQTGSILPPTTAGNVLLGYAVARGDLNGDDFDDLALGAPTQTTRSRNSAGAVYVYFGGPGGIGRTPDVVIEGTEVGARLGSGLAVLPWTSDAHDDLVIGAPGAQGGSGRLYVFQGGAALAPGTRADTTADATLGVHATTPGWFAISSLGARLARGDFDGDGMDDLIVAAPTGGPNRGGVAIVYGGTVAGASVQLSDVDASGLAGAVVDLVEDPAATTGRQFGFYVHAVGPTQGVSDRTDDLLVAYVDDYAVAGEAAYVLRGDGVRATAAGVYPRAFTVGRDVRLEYIVVPKVAELGAQATTIEDQNGDGARDLVIAAYRAANGSGQVLIVDGDVVGDASGVARTNQAGVVLTTLAGGGVSKLGAIIAPNHASRAPDIDGDGREDLVVAGVAGGLGRLYTWYGGSIPRGTGTVATAGYVVTAPTGGLLTVPMVPGAAGQGVWLDANGDGLEDVCWAMPNDNARDGLFEVLWDDRR